MSDAITEAAARALLKWDGGPIDPTEWYYEAAHAVLAAVTPLIEANALERAAQVAENVDRDVAGHSTSWSVGYFARHIRDTAAAIRALKEQP